MPTHCEPLPENRNATRGRRPVRVPPGSPMLSPAAGAPFAKASSWERSSDMSRAAAASRSGPSPGVRRQSSRRSVPSRSARARWASASRESAASSSNEASGRGSSSTATWQIAPPKPNELTPPRRASERRGHGVSRSWTVRLYSSNMICGFGAL